MLAMRRTLWVVRELVPIVFAAATRAVAGDAAEAARGFVRDSGVSTRPGAWIRAPATQRRRGGGTGRGDDDRDHARRAAAGEEAPLRLRALGGGAEPPRACSADGDGGAARPRPAARNVDQPAVPLGHDRGLARRADRRRRRRRGARGPARRWLAAFGPATETASAGGGLDGARDPGGAGGSPHAEVDLGGPTGYVLADDVEPTSPPPRRRRPDARSDDDGLEGARVVPRPARSDALRLERQRRADRLGDGRIVGGWSQRRDGEIALGLLEDVGRDASAAIDAEAERLAEGRRRRASRPASRRCSSGSSALGGAARPRSGRIRGLRAPGSAPRIQACDG